MGKLAMGSSQAMDDFQNREIPTCETYTVTRRASNVYQVQLC